MSAWQFVLLVWVATAVAALRPMGSWYLNREKWVPRSRQPYCHEEAEGPYQNYHRSPTFCASYHSKGCYRVDMDPVLKDRTLKDGFAIVGAALAWPVLMWPFLALGVTPKSSTELKLSEQRAREEQKRLENEIAKLQKEQES